MDNLLFHMRTSICCLESKYALLAKTHFIKYLTFLKTHLSWNLLGLLCFKRSTLHRICVSGWDCCWMWDRHVLSRIKQIVNELKCSVCSVSIPQTKHLRWRNHIIYKLNLLHHKLRASKVYVTNQHLERCIWLSFSKQRKCNQGGFSICWSAATKQTCYSRNARKENDGNDGAFYCNAGNTFSWKKPGKIRLLKKSVVCPPLLEAGRWTIQMLLQERTNIGVSGEDKKDLLPTCRFKIHNHLKDRPYDNYSEHAVLTRFFSTSHPFEKRNMSPDTLNIS